MPIKPPKTMFPKYQPLIVPFRLQFTRLEAVLRETQRVVLWLEVAGALLERDGQWRIAGMHDRARAIRDSDRGAWRRAGDGDRLAGFRHDGRAAGQSAAASSAIASADEDPFHYVVLPWLVRPSATSATGRVLVTLEKKESACKPGSVEDNHSSGTAVTGDLKRPTRKRAGTPAATCVATSLFGLAPGGVCRAAECCHRRGALLPHRFTLTSFIAETSAVCFLLHFPSAHAAQALPGTSSAGARTFLHISREMQRLPGRLRRAP